MKIQAAIIAIILGLGASLHADVPSTLNYQGRIMQNGQPFDGTGHFVFGIYEGSTLLWTNKLPVPSPLNDPAAAIDSSDAKALTVRNGVFTVRLGEGDFNNAPVGTDVFFKFDAVQRVRTDVKLKVWFSPAAEGPYTRLDPDITFTSVPFAQVAGVAETVKNNSITSAMIATGAVTIEKLTTTVAIPSGTVVPFAGTAVPAGWALCSGQTLDGTQTENSALFATLGLSYGGTGTNFKVPDLRGRTVIGTGQGDTWTGAGGATNWLLGIKFGAEKHLMTASEMPAHGHGVNDPGHSHNFTYQGAIASPDGDNANPDLCDERVLSGTTAASLTGISIQSAGGSQPHNIIQPSLVLNYIIKL